MVGNKANDDAAIKKRSERVLKLFNAIKGNHIGEFPGPIPPFSKWLNSKLISAQRGEIELEFKLRPEMANPTGLLHGGMQAALMDDTIGMCTATLGYEGFLITIDAQFNYLGKVRVDENVRVKAKIVREGRIVVNFYAEISDLKGNLIATGNTNLLRTQFKPDYMKTVDGSERIEDLAKKEK